MAMYVNVSGVMQTLSHRGGEEFLEVRPGEKIDSEKLGYTPPASSFQKEGLLSKVLKPFKPDPSLVLPKISGMVATNAPIVPPVPQDVEKWLKEQSPSVAEAVRQIINKKNPNPEYVDDPNNPMNVTEKAEHQAPKPEAPKFVDGDPNLKRSKSVVLPLDASIDRLEGVEEEFIVPTEDPALRLMAIDVANQRPTVVAPPTKPQKRVRFRRTFE